MHPSTPGSQTTIANRPPSQENPIPTVNIILLNWNACQDTADCIDQFNDWAEVAPTIWVIDNASTECDILALTSRFPDIHLIQNPQNLGFAGGSNRGITAATGQNSAPLLLLNNDARLSESTMVSLLDTLDARSDIGIVGPLLYDVGETRRLISAGSRNPVRHLHNLTTQLPAEAVSIVDYVSGSVALVRSDVFGRIGLLDEAYFFSGEVADLCRRARDSGYSTAVISAGEAEHALDRSSSFRGTLYTYYIIRNRFLYIRKFYRIMRMPLLVFWAAYGLALTIRVRLAGNKAGAIAIWLGTLDGVFGRFGNQNERIIKACQD